MSRQHRRTGRLALFVEQAQEDPAAGAALPAAAAQPVEHRPLPHRPIEPDAAFDPHALHGAQGFEAAAADRADR